MSLLACWTAVQGFHGTHYESLNHKNRKTTRCCSKTQKTHSSLHNRDSHGGDHSKLLKCTGCTASQQVLLAFFKYVTAPAKESNRFVLLFFSLLSKIYIQSRCFSFFLPFQNHLKHSTSIPRALHIPHIAKI